MNRMAITRLIAAVSRALAGGLGFSNSRGPDCEYASAIFRPPTSRQRIMCAALGAPPAPAPLYPYIDGCTQEAAELDFSRALRNVNGVMKELGAFDESELGADGVRHE
jgi:hypothetical protein